ncbi:MAG TPA: glycosyltransferase [Chloroflexota bacterium]|nr:glycosyltransferase [Chloroflexota bacterium]
MRILIVSKILVVAAYRHKLDEIAARPEVERLVVVTPPAWHERGGRTWMLEPSAGPQAYDLRIEPIRFNGSYHLFYWPGLGRVMRDVRPDLVHLDEEPYNLATAHGSWLAGRVGARSLFFTWQNQVRHYPPPFNWFERSVFRRSAFALAGSSEALRVLRTKGYAGPASVIPQFGVDPNLFTPGPPPPEDAPVIGFISRLVEEKGIFVLLAALASLPGRWRLHVVGTGPQEARARRRAAELGLSERIVWERAVASTLIPERLRTFTMLVQPSLTRRNWKEQFGRAMMEAMACGVAVIGSTSAEIPNVIGDAGLIVPEGDAAALREAIAHLLADRQAREEFGRRGRRRVLECYTNERIAAQTVGVYNAVLGRACLGGVDAGCARR